MIESVDQHPDPVTVRTASEVLANKIRIEAVTHYNLLYLPVWRSVRSRFWPRRSLYWRRALISFTYMLALGLWGLTFIRAFLLSLIDATSFPALQVTYLSAAYFMAVGAAVISIAALLQLSGLSAGPHRLANPRVLRLCAAKRRQLQHPCRMAMTAPGRCREATGTHAGHGNRCVFL